MDLIDEVDCVEVGVDEFVNGFVAIGDCLRSKGVEGCRIEVNVLSSMFVCSRPRAKLWQYLKRTLDSLSPLVFVPCRDLKSEIV